MTNPKVREETVVSNGREFRRHIYWCPGCETIHAVAINQDKADNGAGWDFSGTIDCPTYSPSQLTTYGETNKRCHTFIRNGMIEFLGDCTHALAGKTVPLPPLPDWALE